MADRWAHDLALDTIYLEDQLGVSALSGVGIMDFKMLPLRIPAYAQGVFGWLVVVFIGALKKWDSVVNPQFFAEDSTVFFYAAWSWGEYSIPMFHVGYIQILQRVLALIYVEVVPLNWLPLCFNLTGLLIGSTCFWAFSLKGFRYLVPQDSLRFLFACVVAFIHPAIALTSFFTSFFWYLGFGSLLILLYPYRSIAGRVLGLILMLVVTVSCPLVLGLAPVAVLVILIGSKQLKIQGTIYLACSAFQAYLVLFKGPGTGFDFESIGLFLKDSLELLRLTITGVVVNYPLTYQLQNSAYLISWILAVFTLVLLLVVVLKYGKIPQVLTYLWLLGTAFGLLLLVRTFRADGFLEEPTRWFLGDPVMDHDRFWPWRYLFTPYILIIFGLCYSVSLLWENWRALGRRYVAGFCVLFVAYHMYAVPKWGKMEDAGWENYTEQLTTGWHEPLKIPMNPMIVGWTLDIPVVHPKNPPYREEFFRRVREQQAKQK